MRKCEKEKWRKAEEWKEMREENKKKCSREGKDGGIRGRSKGERMKEEVEESKRGKRQRRKEK